MTQWSPYRGNMYHTGGGKYMETGLGSYKQGIVSTKRIYTYFRRFLSLAGIEHKGLGYGPRLHDE